MTTERQEPILADTDLPEGSSPLLLTKLVREGLPPPLWRRYQEDARAGAGAFSGEGTAVLHQEPDASPDGADTVPPLLSNRTAQGTEGLPVPMHMSAEADPGTADARKHLEDTELAKALERIRKLSFTYSPKPALADGIPERENTADLENGEADEQTLQEPVSPAEIQPVAEPGDSAVGEEPDLKEAPASLAVSDMTFLREFESLLFNEIERRVTAELEETLTQYLQKAWKEQVILSITRTLALEGIRIRESLRQELRQALPEILQRVLHEGLNEAPSQPNEY